MSKMQYYRLITDGGPKRGKDIIARPRIEVEDTHIVKKGILINNWNNDMVFEYDPKEGNVAIEFLCCVYCWDIFSEKAVKLLGDLISSDIQLLPIRVVNRDSDLEIEKYFVVNVLPHLDALDLENSVYSYLDVGDEKRLSVKKYAIKEEKIGNHHIFRLKSSPFSIFVSEEFYKIAKKNKMRGYEFVKVKAS